MPQIGLRYTGDDASLKSKLAKNEGIQYFEPVDAREILAQGNREYEIPEESRKQIGTLYDSRTQGLYIPQLQGNDAELQTGLSEWKYGRAQVVKANPEAAQPGTGGPQSTVGRPLDLSMVESNAAAPMPQQSTARSEGMTRPEIVAALEARNVEFDKQATKPVLAELLDSQRS